MKKKLLTFLLLPLSFSMASNAAVVCKGTTESGKQISFVQIGNTYENFRPCSFRLIEIQVEDDRLFFPKINDIWDGHMTGTINAKTKNLTLKATYEGHYGAFRNVILELSNGSDFNEKATFLECEHTQF